MAEFKRSDSEAQREAIHNQLFDIKHTLELHQEKFQKLAQHLVGKPINGEPVDAEGGWCGRMGSRMNKAEAALIENEGRMYQFEMRTPTKRGILTMFLAGTAVLGIIQAIGVFLVWAHK